MAVHEKALTGFTNAVDEYARGRPDYPAEAVAHVVRTLGLGWGKTVLEVGAGTGKLTRLLIPAGATVLAVEPVEAMRTRLRADFPALQVLDGTAEQLPASDSSVDGVVAAQAFHWFDGPRALAEFQRVMRPGASLALVWNIRDETSGWMRQLSSILEPLEGDTPRHQLGRWQHCFDDSAFEPLTHATFPHVQRGAPEMVVDRVASISFIAALPPADRSVVLAQVRELLATSPETQGRTTVEIPYETHVYTSRLREIGAG